MKDISNLEVNGNGIETDFVYNEETVTVLTTPVKDAEVNGTESEEVNLTLHQVETDFVYNEEELPVTVTVFTTPMKDAGESECGDLIEKVIKDISNVEVNGNGIESEEMNLTMHEVETDFVYNEEDLPVTVTVLPPVKDGGVSGLDLITPRVSPVLCSQNDGPKLKRNASSCKKLGSRKNKKQRKGKRVCLFVGEPVSETEAKQRWGWRYELKGQIGKGKSCILNAGEEDEVHLNVACHYLQADVNGSIFSLGDCAHVEGEGKQQHVGRIVEFFKTSDDENYFRVQWFFRAEDTVMKEAAAFHDKKRLFFSTLMNDNLLECILSKVKIIEKAPTLGFQSTSIKPSEYYCDMEYSVKYSTFRSLVPGKRIMLAFIICLPY